MSYQFLRFSSCSQVIFPRLNEVLTGGFIFSHSRVILCCSPPSSPFINLYYLMYLMVSLYPKFVFFFIYLFFNLQFSGFCFCEFPFLSSFVHFHMLLYSCLGEDTRWMNLITFTHSPSEIMLLEQLKFINLVTFHGLPSPSPPH